MMQITIEHKGRFFRFAWVDDGWLAVKKNGSRCLLKFPIAVWKQLADRSETARLEAAKETLDDANTSPYCR